MIEVADNLALDSLDEKEKVQRMKLELQFARDSSTLLPKTDPIFRVQVTIPETGKRRQKTPVEFGAALKVLPGKRSNRAVVEYGKFQDALEKIAVGLRNRREGSD